MKLFNKQSLTLLKDKKLMIAIIAVIFIPILYAGMFLWAFWDPYAHLEDIPVAIVNEDTPYEFEGETFELGNELVNKLREEDEFDFHFVERRDGYKGLQNEDYYILIEIPEDFSKNATTLMDDHPDQLVIRYVPNESYNFLASQIGETAMLQIEMALEQKITETYAETIFEKVDEIKNGLTEANDATEELANGANELSEGADEIKEHLLVLANKSIEFTNGTNKLKNGAKQLTDGTNELAAGIQQLDDANNELFRGAKRIQDGNIRLRDGIQTANDGAKEINERLPYLVNGTDILSTSLKQFENELPKQMAKQINQTMSNGSSNFKKGLTHLEEGIINGLGTSSESEGLAPQLTNGLIKGINNELNEMNFNLQQLPNQIADRLAKQVATEIVDNQRNQVNDIVNAMKEAGLSEEQINIIVDRFTSNFVNEEQFEKLLKQQIKDELENDFNELDHYITNKQNDIGTTISSAVYDAIEQTEVKISDGFLQFSNEVSNNLDTVSGNIEHMITKSVKPTFKQLEQGVNTINNGQKQLQIGMNELANGVNELKRGSSTIVDGQDELMNNMDLFTNKFSTANSGINELYYSSKRLLDGVIQIDDGAKLLSDGSRELANGSKNLAEGMDTLNDGTEQFHAEMTNATNEINDVESTEETYHMMANPVEVNNDKINEVPNYGTGFAPYFLSLGLYVGALLLSIVYPLREPSIIPTSGFNWFLRKTIGLTIIGVLQALIAATVLLFGLGIDVESVTLFYLYSIVTSLTFIALIQFLVTCFDDPGRFIAIIILILQLTTSAGTFPLELIPKVLQPLNAILPMTYTVAGFKAVISSGQYVVMWQNVGILAIFIITSLLFTLAYFTIMFKRKFGALQKA